MMGVENLLSVEENGYEFVGGEEEDFVADVRRPSRMFFTVESLVVSDVGQVLLLFKLDKKKKQSDRSLKSFMALITDSVWERYLSLVFVVG